jgi:hypothetical protein
MRKNCGKLQVKKSLERSRRRWDDDIKMNLKEIELEGVEWINLAEDGDL